MDALNAMDNPAADSFGGFLSGLGGGAPQATLQDALNAPAPQVNMPQRGQADTSKIAPLAMLALAASIAQRRQQGQSRTSQILDGALRAAQVAGSLKQEAEGQVDRRYQQDVAAAKAQQELQSGAIKLDTANRENNFAKAAAPMQMESLKLKMEKAKTEAEVDAIELRLKKLREGSAKELLDNEIRMGKAKTEAEIASVRQKDEQIRAQMKQADAALLGAQAQRDRVRNETDLIAEGKKQPKINVGKALPGEPVPISGVDADGTTWTSYQPMSPAEAELYIRDQYKSLEKAGAKLGPVEEYVTKNLKTYTEPQRRVMSGKGAQQPGTTPPTGATPAAAQQPVTPASKAMEFSVKNPGKVARTSDGTYFLDGKVVDEAEAARRLNMTVEQLRAPRAQPVGAAAAKPNLAGTQSGVAAPTPQVTQMSAIERQAQMEMAEVAAGKRSKMGLSFNVIQYLREKALAEQAAAQGNPR